MSTVAHFFIIIVAQKFVITWLTFSLTFTAERPARHCSIPKCPVIAVQAAMRHSGQEIPVKKTKRWERLQGQLGYDQPGQQELSWPRRCRKILGKETKQTTNNRIFEV